MISKLRLAVKAALVVTIFASLAGAGGGDEYIRYTDSQFSYRLKLPEEWKRSVQDRDYTHVLTLRRGDRADITVTATSFDDKEKIKWEQWKNWYAKGIGSPVSSVIETRELPVGGTMYKIMVFEYVYRGRRMLQRTMLAKNGGRILVIECRAPIRYYSEYIDVFNKVMSSVDFSGGGTGEGEKAIESDTKTDRRNAGTVDTDKSQGRIGREEAKKDEFVEKEDTATAKLKDDNANTDAMKRLEEEKALLEEELKKIEELEKKGIIKRINDSEMGL